MNDTRKGITNLKLNETKGEIWDIIITDGQLELTTGDDYLTQKVKSLLQTAVGEVTENMEFGVPYFEQILGIKNPDLALIKSIFENVIVESEVLKKIGVTSANIASISLDKVNRDLKINDLIVTTKSDEVTIKELTV
jgi:hypothetical protein